MTVNKRSVAGGSMRVHRPKKTTTPLTPSRRTSRHSRVQMTEVATNSWLAIAEYPQVCYTGLQRFNKTEMRKEPSRVAHNKRDTQCLRFHASIDPAVHCRDLGKGLCEEDMLGSENKKRCVCLVAWKRGVAKRLLAPAKGNNRRRPKA